MPRMFERIAHVYDLVYDYKTEDIEFYQDLAKKAGSPALELACGTGRILIPIAREGVKITGIDLTENMLKILKKKLRKENESTRKNVEVMKGNMVNFRLKKFNMICLPFTSFFVLNKAEQKKCLKNVYNHLNPKGIFVMDAFHFDSNHPQDVIQHHNTVPYEGGYITKMASNVREDRKQMMHVTFFYDFISRKGQVKRIIEKFDLHWVLPDQMREMLKAAGFGKIGLYGDFEKGKFTKDSKTMVFIAEKS